MFKQILAGTDGSDTAEKALGRAIDLAAEDGATLNVITAYHLGARRAPRDGDVPRDVRHQVGALEDVNLVLANAASRARSAGVEVKTQAIKGDASEAILDAADRAGADLIVVGSKGMSGARRFLGSVPNHVSHHASCTVMIVNTA